MVKALNFNTYKRPALPLVMCDEAQTKINVTTPTEGLIEELQAVAPELEALTSDTKGAEVIPLIYDLAARLMSCNRENLTVTVEDLRGKYGIGLEFLLLFFNAYLDFINEIARAKN